VQERLELHGSAVGVFREKLVDVVLFVGLRRSVGAVFQPVVQFVDSLAVVVVEGHDPAVVSRLPPAEAERELTVAEDGTAVLVEPRLGTDLFAVELDDPVLVLCPEKHDAAHAPRMASSRENRSGGRPRSVAPPTVPCRSGA
jgi:hypothetical protein